MRRRRRGQFRGRRPAALPNGVDLLVVQPRPTRPDSGVIGPLRRCCRARNFVNDDVSSVLGRTVVVAGEVGCVGGRSGFHREDS
jgi:hypothetical protein